MRTTIDLPVGLIKKAMTSYRVRTKRDAVVRALQDRIANEERLVMYKRLKGSMPGLDIDLDALRERAAGK